MKVLKFGGSSLANAHCFNNVSKIIDQSSSTASVAIVVSAPQGITNDLVALIVSLTSNHASSSTNTPPPNHQTKIIEKLTYICETVYQQYPLIEQQFIQQGLEELIARLSQLVQGATLLCHCPESTQAQILSIGEKFSALILSAFIQSLNHQLSPIDPELFLTINSQSTEPVADIDLSKKRFKENYSSLKNIAIMPGFFGVKANGETTTLGRNGSDYSAAILAVCLQAEICEIWTDVNGVYNADPRLVKDAQLIKNMSYHEAMELSYFGAKILHPKTIAPLSLHQIPCLIKNTHAPDLHGTLISNETSSQESVKAISNLSDVSMINVSGPGMKGMVGMASRIFSAISLANISVIMISQSSSEYSISFCVPGNETDAAVNCLNQAFELELKHELLEPISVKKELAIITLVGDRMQHQKGIAAKFFKSLSQTQVNIIAIAQDSSERSISAVIRNQRCDDAIKVCHQNLFLKKPSIDAFIIGCGTIGKELIAQIQKQQNWLSHKNIALNVVAIANSQQLLLDKNGVDLTQWQQNLEISSDVFSLTRLKQFVNEAHLSNPVLIDCTSSESIALEYPEFLSSRFHLVTANKKANTMNFSFYQKIRKIAQQQHRRFLYETNVGAGLPVIDNLQGLLRAGDELIQFEGILSGSLSYIFGELHNGLSLSEATIKARELGFTEPNPAEDLSGLDVARKVLIIAREAGLKIELEDIQLTPVVPKELAELTDGNEFILKLPSLDHAIKKLVDDAESKGEVLRYVASISEKQCKVSIQSVNRDHPLYNVTNGENALALETHYYQPKPFVIRGYGAGAKVTAAGLFGDLLRTLAWEQEI